MTRTNIFGALFKGISEAANGRIRWRSNMWALVGGRFDKRRVTNERLIGSNFAPEGQLFNADRTAVLVSAKCAINCPRPPVNGLYQVKPDEDWGMFNVPHSICRKCPNYMAGGRRIRYARCALLRDKQPETKAATEFVDIVNSAVEKANKILGG